MAKWLAESIRARAKANALAELQSQETCLGVLCWCWLLAPGVTSFKDTRSGRTKATPQATQQQPPVPAATLVVDVDESQPLTATQPESQVEVPETNVMAGSQGAANTQARNPAPPSPAPSLNSLPSRQSAQTAQSSSTSDSAHWPHGGIWRSPVACSLESPACHT